MPTSNQQRSVFAEEPQAKTFLNRNTVSILSPLRYPGSKRRLAGYIAETIRLNGLLPELYVEPFAGGASVALQLLNDGLVENVGLIDCDPLIASFWQVVFWHSEWLIEQVETIEVSLERWQKYKESQPTEVKEQALKCLFLNRTSFSGIIRPEVGPIGGRAQDSPYPIDCRFPRETLVKRITQASKLADRVEFVWCMSWEQGLAAIQAKQVQGKYPTGDDLLYYFDPPFFEKADKLYNFFFRKDGHERLRDEIVELKDAWILSYDAADRAQALYRDAAQSKEVEILYTLSGNGGGRKAEEIILSNLAHLPEATRLWGRKEEWKNGGV